MSTIDPQESALKLALDNAENEGVPALQTKIGTHNDRGSLTLILPRHPPVTAFIRELDEMEYETVDLKTARLRLRAALKDYDARVIRRITNDIPGLALLSDILVARAAGKHWHKMILKLEAEKKLKEQREQNRRHIARHRLRSMGILP